MTATQIQYQCPWPDRSIVVSTTDPTQTRVVVKLKSGAGYLQHARGDGVAVTRENMAGWVQK